MHTLKLFSITLGGLRAVVGDHTVYLPASDEKYEALDREGLWFLG